MKKEKEGLEVKIKKVQRHSNPPLKNKESNTNETRNEPYRASLNQNPRSSFQYKGSLNEMKDKDSFDFSQSELLSWLKSFNTQIADLYKYINKIENRLDEVIKDFNFHLGSNLNQWKQTEHSLKNSLQRMESKVSLLNACLLERKIEEVQVKNIKDIKK